MISKTFIEAEGDLVARVKCTLPTHIYTASDVVLAPIEDREREYNLITVRSPL
jgi:hypothetical protein